MLDEQIKKMPKAELMDRYVDSFEGKISSFEIIKFVKSIFQFDLDSTPIIDGHLGETAVNGLLDSHLAKYEKDINGAVIRQLINQTVGINLDAISALEGSRISLFSKEQWVIRHEQDLFVVYTGEGDVDAKVFPTPYFMEQTGLNGLPEELQQLLTDIGYKYDETVGSCYYSNPTGEAVPDSFKGQTMGSILKVIQTSYKHL
ncbi:hypothetical protein HPT25_07230 [Bacillus sp. BRMEA1]|nr:hypothetical protein [Neobacillus endophyticus]